MRKAPISLQDLRRRIDAKAKAEESWRFWGLFVHVCKMETLRHPRVPSRNRRSKVGRITGNRREVGRRHEGGGGVRRSGEAGEHPWSQGTLLSVIPPTRGEAGAR